jgi:uncharacterized membrane protein YhaH (DUF805 family)
MNLLASLWKKKYSWDFGATKSEYWLGFLIYLVSTAFVSFVSLVAIDHDLKVVATTALIIWFLTFGLGFNSLAVRRAHEAGISGAWIFIPPMRLVVGFLPAKPQNNRYIASGVRCANGHDQFEGSVWCIECQAIGADARISVS